MRLANPDYLDREASSFRPHLVMCSDDAPAVSDVSVPSWVVFRYHDCMSASVFLEGRGPHLVEDASIEDLLGLMDETQRMIP